MPNPLDFLLGREDQKKKKQIEADNARIEREMQPLRQKANQRLVEQARTGTIPVGNVVGRGVLKPQAIQARAYDQQLRAITGNGTPLQTGVSSFKTQNPISGSIRNIFDSNSEVDKINRVREGRPQMYRDAQIATGNMRPFENLGQHLIGNSARLVNTTIDAAQSIPLNVRIQTARATRNMPALESSLKDANDLNNRITSGRTGALNAGNFLYNNAEEARTMSTLEGLKRSAFNTAGVASEVLPYKLNVLKGARLAPRLAANAGVDAALGVAESVPRQYLQTGNVSAGAVVGDAVGNAVFGMGDTLGRQALKQFKGETPELPPPPPPPKTPLTPELQAKRDGLVNAFTIAQDTGRPELAKGIAVQIDAIDNPPKGSLREKIRLAKSQSGFAGDAMSDQPTIKNVFGEDVPNPNYVPPVVEAPQVGKTTPNNQRTIDSYSTPKPVTEYKVGERVSNATAQGGMVDGTIVKAPDFTKDLRIKGNNFEIKLDDGTTIKTDGAGFDTPVAQVGKTKGNMRQFEYTEIPETPGMKQALVELERNRLSTNYEAASYELRRLATEAGQPELYRKVMKTISEQDMSQAEAFEYMRKGLAQMRETGTNAKIRMGFKGNESSAVAQVGKTPTVYHGTRNEFDTFKGGFAGGAKTANDSSGGFYFSPMKEVADNYAGTKYGKGRVVEAQLDIKNPKIAKSYQEIGMLTKEDIAKAKSEGYDGYYYKPSKEAIENGSESARNEEWVAFDDKQIIRKVNNATNNEKLAGQPRGLGNDANSNIPANTRGINDTRSIGGGNQSNSKLVAPQVGKTEPTFVRDNNGKWKMDNGSKQTEPSSTKPMSSKVERSSNEGKDLAEFLSESHKTLPKDTEVTIKYQPAGTQTVIPVQGKIKSSYGGKISNDVQTMSYGGKSKTYNSYRADGRTLVTDTFGNTHVINNMDIKSVEVAPQVGKTAKAKTVTAPSGLKVEERYVTDYAKTLKEMDSGKGGQMIETPDGYKRVTEHSPFYSNFYKENKRKPTDQDWIAEAKRQVESGEAGADFYDYVASDIEALASNKVNTPSKRMSVAEKESLFNEVPAGTDKNIKVQAPNNGANVPVRKVTQEGDVVTKTNVNPNIKAREKVYSMDNDGNLIEDQNGAYRLFTDDDGKVTGFRAGKEYTDIKDLGNLSDVNEYGSTLATMRRNIERSFGKDTGDKVNRFLVDHQQESATKLISKQVEYNNGMKKVADDLGISFAGIGRRKAQKVSADIQNFGEGRMTRAELDAKYGKEYADKIANADRWFRTQYDTLLDEMNGVLTQYGYDPVPKRKNYYTHFQEPKLWEKFGLKMQEIRNLANPTMQDAMPDKARGSVPNKLAGESEYLQPNKRFNQFALQRKGDQRTADAFQAFEKYLSPTLNNIYMTPSITRARVLAKAVAQDADLAGKDATGVLIQVKEWANNLAGKSNRLGDRQLSDSKTGRKYLEIANWAQKKAGQNSILGNLSTAVMQPIVLTQTTGKFGFKNTILAAIQEMGTAHKMDAPIRQSQFMKRRYANLNSVTRSGTDVARSVANKPLEIVEETSARITWNSAYNDAISKNLKGKEAIRYADIEAEKTLSGRSLGEKPELFRSKAAGPATMFQLEVNNYWQQFGKEMNTTQKARTVVAAYAFGLLLQQVTGRDAGFNPIDALVDSYGELEKDKSGKDKAIAIAQRLTGEVVDSVPIVPQVATMLAGDKNVKKVLGQDSNVGRFGVSSPISSLVTNPIGLIAPFGASQVKKTYQGLTTALSGKLENKDGDTLVDVPRTPANIARGALFGRNAIPEVNQYYDNLGRDKVDQKPVQNQIQSEAGTQSMAGLTQKQQEMLSGLPAQDKQDYKTTAVNDNKSDAKVKLEKEEFEKTDSTSKELSNGKVYAKVGDEYKTFDNKEAYDKAIKKEEKQKKIDEFVSGDEKMKEIDGKIYLKSDDTETGYTTKTKAEWNFDKETVGLDVGLDKAKANDDLKTWNELAEKKYNALVKKKESYDPDTEFDKIDTINKQLLNLEQDFAKYAGYGGFKKGKKSGSKGSGTGIDSTAFKVNNITSDTYKNLDRLLAGTRSTSSVEPRKVATRKAELKQIRVRA